MSFSAIFRLYRRFEAWPRDPRDFLFFGLSWCINFWSPVSVRSNKLFYIVMPLLSCSARVVTFLFTFSRHKRNGNDVVFELTTIFSVIWLYLEFGNSLQIFFNIPWLAQYRFKRNIKRVSKSALLYAKTCFLVCFLPTHPFVYPQYKSQAR